MKQAELRHALEFRIILTWELFSPKRFAFSSRIVDF